MSEFVILEGEQERAYPNLYFEPGDHSVSQRDVLADDSFWINAEQILARMRTYHPRVLAIDGVSTQTGGEWVVSFLPGSVAEIHPSGMITVVGADIPWWFDISSSVDTALKEWGERERDLGAIRIYEELFGPAVVLGIIGAALSKTEKGQSSPLPTKRWTRRRFLKAMLFGGMALGYAGTLVRSEVAKAAANVQTPEQRDAFLRLARTWGPKFIDDDWARMRTALLITKEKDAIDILGLPPDTPGAVIAGYSHSYEALDMLRNEGVCRDVIVSYRRRLTPVVHDAIQDSHVFGEMPETEAQRLVSDALAQMSIMTVGARPPGNHPLRRGSDNSWGYVHATSMYQSPRITAMLEGI